MKRLSIEAGLYAGIKNIDEIFEVKALDDPIFIRSLVSLEDNEHNIVNDFVAFMDYLYEHTEGEYYYGIPSAPDIKVYLMPGVIMPFELSEVAFQLGSKTKFSNPKNYVASCGRGEIQTCLINSRYTYIDFSDSSQLAYNIRMIVRQIGWDAAYTILQNVVMRELLKFSSLFYYDKWDHAVQIKDAEKDKYQLFVMYNEIIYDIVQEVTECLK